MNFEIRISSHPTGKHRFEIEVTQNYEGDKWHVAVFEKEGKTYTHYETIGLDTWGQLQKYLKDLQDKTE